MTKYAVGDQIGKFQIITRTSGTIKPGQAVKWQVECACGNSYVRPTSYITRNKDKGCSRCRPKKASHKYTGTTHISGDVWGGIVRRSKAAQRRGRTEDIPFEIDIHFGEDLFQKQNFKCAYTGWPIEFPLWDRANARYTEGTASLDRINSSLGYTKDNVAWVHKYVNKAKNDLPLGTFLSLCHAVSVNREIQAVP